MQKTDSKNVKGDIKNGLVYFLPLVFQNILPFVTFPIFTRLLSPEEYGLLGLGIIYATFMTGISNFGMTLAFERNYFQYRFEGKKLSQLLFSSIFFVHANFFLMLIITYLFLEPFSIFILGSLDNKWLLVGIFVALFYYNTINQFYFIYFRNKENSGQFSKYNIILSILYFVFSMFLVVVLRIGVWGIIVAEFAAGFILFVVLGIKFIQQLGFSLNKEIILESLKLSYPLTPRIFLGVLSAQFNKYMIGLLSTIGNVGIYHIAQKIANLSFTLMSALQNVYNPEVYKKMFDDKPGVGKEIGKYLTPSLYLSILIPLTISFFSQELLFVLAPKNYSDAIPVIMILSMYYGILYFSKIVGIQLVFKKKTFITSLLSIVGLALNVGINIPLIKNFGVMGAAWGTFISGAISVSISSYISRRYYKIDWELKKVISIISIFILGNLAILFLYLTNQEYLWCLFAKLIIFSGYLLLGARYNIVTWYNIVMIKESILNRK
ncbi:MAG: oligosaccharide flippase family protein [bacterium]|nr:oligosaccharide flippase family protein [bacterium]